MRFSVDHLRPIRPRRPYGVLLLAATLAACGLGLVLVPTASAPAHAHDAVPLQNLATRSAARATTAVALDGALAAASTRSLAMAERLGEAPTAAPAEPADPDAIIPTDPPEAWLTTYRGPCRRHRTRGYCDGPLKVAKPHGKAAERAEELGLGTLQTASHLLREAPEPAWVEAVRGEERRSLRWPVDGGRLGRGVARVQRKGGGRRLHKGVDIGADPGTPVLAVNDALVAYAHNEVKGYGNLVILVHADGTTSWYAHLKAAYVFPGQRIKRSQVVGEVGYTGLARGPHLHFEWRRRAYPRDPVVRFVAVPDDQRERFPRRALARR